jgi:hypothetical protein
VLAFFTVPREAGSNGRTHFFKNGDVTQKTGTKYGDAKNGDVTRFLKNGDVKNGDVTRFLEKWGRNTVSKNGDVKNGDVTRFLENGDKNGDVTRFLGDEASHRQRVLAFLLIRRKTTA